MSNHMCAGQLLRDILCEIDLCRGTSRTAVAEGSDSFDWYVKFDSPINSSA